MPVTTPRKTWQHQPHLEFLFLLSSRARGIEGQEPAHHVEAEAGQLVLCGHPQLPAQWSLLWDLWAALGDHREPGDGCESQAELSALQTRPPSIQSDFPG